MKMLHRIVEVAFAGLLVSGCAHNQAHSMSSERMIGPLFFGGVPYYPAKPGETYKNTTVDYTTNRPPAGAITYVTVISTNGIPIHLIDGEGPLTTNILSR
jgi:hypothetical protein